MARRLLLLVLLCPAAALLAPPRLLPQRPLVTRRPIDWARHGLVQASGEPSSSKSKWRPVLLGAGGGATLVAARRFGGAGAVTALLKFACVALPLFSAARHLRNGRKRDALLVVLLAAYRRFCSNWWQYLTIPLFAGGVGWLTNKVAVDMIFYPVEFAGLKMRTWANQPLGLLGWQVSRAALPRLSVPPSARALTHPAAHSLTRPLALPPAHPPACHGQGIVPCKAGVMAGRLVSPNPNPHPDPNPHPHPNPNPYPAPTPTPRRRCG